MKDLNYKYKLVSNLSELNQLISYCKQTGYASTDFETTGTNAMYPGSKPTILGVSFQPGSSWIIPLAHKESCFKDDWKKVLKLFGREVIENPDIVKIGQNVKYEMNWWKKYNIKMVGRVFDTMLAKYLLDEERPNGLKEIVARFIPEFAGYDLDGQPGEKATQDKIIEFWSNVPLQKLSKYCALDADLTFRLYIFFETRLINLGFYPLFRNMMMMASRVLSEAEWEGMLIDRDYLSDLVISYEEKIKQCEKDLRSHKFLRLYEKKKKERVISEMISELQSEIKQLKKDGKSTQMIKNREEKISRYIAGEFTSNKESKKMEPTNFSSPVQMIDLLFESEYGFKFDVVKYTSDKKTKKETERPSTDEEVLLELKTLDESGFIESLLRLRELTKMYSTYVKGMWDRMNSKNKIHGSFLLHGTVTGRLSSRNPNLQNIPRDCINYNTSILTNRGYIRIGKQVPKSIGIFQNTDRDLMVKTHLGNWKHITHWVNKGKKKMFLVKMVDGSSIRCTMGHQLKTLEKGFIALSEIIKYNLTIIIDED